MPPHLVTFRSTVTVSIPLQFKPVPNETARLALIGVPVDADLTTGFGAHSSGITSETPTTLYLNRTHPVGVQLYDFKQRKTDHEARSFALAGRTIIEGIVEDVDPSFDCYSYTPDNKPISVFAFKKKGLPQEVFQFASSYHTGQNTKDGSQSIPIMHFPADADHSRWFLFCDDKGLVYGCMKKGDNSTIYLGRHATYYFLFGFHIIPVINIPIPEFGQLNHFHRQALLESQLYDKVSCVFHTSLGGTPPYCELIFMSNY